MTLLRRQADSRGDLGRAGFAAAERLAFVEQLRPGGAMDRAVDAAAAEQRLFAALTMASTASVVMSATTISIASTGLGGEKRGLHPVTLASTRAAENRA